MSGMLTLEIKTSVPMILGVSTLPMIVRTVVPSNGLLILVGKYCMAILI
jgi:hypothetical protein